MKKNNRWKNLITHIGILLGCFMVATLFFSPFIKGSMSFHWDTQEFGFTYLNQVTKSISEKGVLPLWNNYNFSGYPFAGDIESGMFYPVNWIFAFFFGAISFPELVFYFIFHFAIGSYFAYLLCNKITKNEFASIVGAVAFAYSGYALGHISHMGQVIFYMWMPASLLGWYYHQERRTLLSSLTSGAILGTNLLIGHPNSTVYLLYILAGITLFSSLIPFDKNWLKKIFLRSTPLLFGLLFASVLIFPVAELTVKSNRTELNYEQQSQNFSLKPTDVAGLINANHNNVLGQNLSEYKGSVDITQGYLYMGIFPLIAIICAFFWKLKKNENNNSLEITVHKYFYFATGIIVLLLAMGYNTPLNKLFFDILPGFNKVRMAVQVMAVFYLCATILTAIGTSFLLDKISNNLNKIAQKKVIVGAIGIIFILLTLGDIFYHGFNNQLYGDRIPPQKIFDTEEEIQYTKLLRDSSKEPFRVHDETKMLTPNKWMYYGVENIWGNGGIKFKLYNDLFTVTDRMTRQTVSDNLLDFLNTKYLISKRDLDTKHFKKIGETTYENLKVLPRFYFTSDYQVIAPVSAQIEAIKKNQVNFHSSVLLEKKPEYKGRENMTPEQKSEIEIIESSNQKIVLETATKGKKILVMSETYDPGWILKVDGEETEILRANGIFRAIPMNQGSHRIELEYKPSTVLWGQTISILMLIVLVGTALYEVGKRHKYLLTKGK